MDEPLVSILMNCYNGEKYLKEAITSVLAQTYQNWEIIFWDNQSTDRSAEIFHSFRDLRLKYFYAPKHTLLYEARNYALGKASGEFIAFLDVDDGWLPNKLKKQVPLFEDEKIGFVCSNFWIRSERKNKDWKAVKGSVPSGYVANDLLKFNFVGLLTLIVRRSALSTLEYIFNPRYHIIGDYDLVLRISVDWALNYISEPLAYYRLHDSNETNKDSYRQVKELEFWVIDMGRRGTFSNYPNFYFVMEQVFYLKAIDKVMRGDKGAAVVSLGSMSWGKLKFRLLFVLLLPICILRQLKN